MLATECRSQLGLFDPRIDNAGRVVGLGLVTGSGFMDTYTARGGVKNGIINLLVGTGKMLSGCSI